MTPPAAPRRLCAASALPENGAREILLRRGRAERSILLLRRGGAILAYENSCPHRGTPLNWLPDRFLDADGEHLLCGTHGARFRIADGYCVAGPCLGASLKRLAVITRKGYVYLLDGTMPLLRDIS